MANEARIKELLSSEEFTSKLSEVQNMSEVEALFKENGAELSAEDVSKLNAEFEQHSELDENALDNVSGGFYNSRGQQRSFGQFVQYCFTGWIFGESAAVRLDRSWG